MTSFNIKILHGTSLKIIAMLSMFVDHSAVIFVDSTKYPHVYEIMRTFGRLAFPIFCFLIVEGYYHTHNIKKYLGRLLLFAIISEIPFDLMVASVPGTHFGHQNVFFTLFLGLLTVCCIDANRKNVYMNFISIIISCLTAYFLKADYSYYGILQILFFYYMKNMPLYRILGIGMLNMYMGQPFGVVALLFIELYNGKRGFNIKYLTYLFYPIHLLVLYSIKIYFFS